MLLSLHPSGFACEYHPSVSDNLSSDNGGFHPFTAKRSRKAKFYNVVQCLGMQKGFNAFFTFTVPERQRNYKETDAALTAAFSRLLESLRLRDKRNQPNGLADYVWVSEAQKRGNIHFHLVTSTRFINITWLNNRWCDAIGQRSKNAVDVQPVLDFDSVLNIAAYFSKYMSKGHSGSEKIDINTGEITFSPLKDRTIYAKSFNYSRNFTVYKPLHIEKERIEQFHTDNHIRSQTKIFKSKGGTEFEVIFHYYQSHNSYLLCKNQNQESTVTFV